MNKAVFLDRDDTITDDPGYLADPGGIVLLDGVDEAIKAFRGAGYLVIVITNQAGIAKGHLTEETLAEVHAELKKQLAERGAPIDAIYYCPFHPDGVVPEYAIACDTRKPMPGMLIQAAGDLDIDLKQSWMIGDRNSDIGAGRNAGCRTIRVANSKFAPKPDDLKAEFDAANVLAASKILLEQDA